MLGLVFVVISELERIFGSCRFNNRKIMLLKINFNIVQVLLVCRCMVKGVVCIMLEWVMVIFVVIVVRMLEILICLVIRQEVNGSRNSRIICVVGLFLFQWLRKCIEWLYDQFIINLVSMLLIVIFRNFMVVLLMVKIMVFIVIVMVNLSEIRLEVLFISVFFCRMFMIFFGICFFLMMFESVMVLVGDSMVVSVNVGISGMFGIIQQIRKLMLIIVMIISVSVRLRILCLCLINLWVGVFQLLVNSSGGINSIRNSFGLNLMCKLKVGYVRSVLMVICISGSGI